VSFVRFRAVFHQKLSKAKKKTYGVSYLCMITDFEPNEAAAIVLDYKLSD
jgi:hypothetical protein